jgi:pilus assembly protein CpaB
MNFINLNPRTIVLSLVALLMAGVTAFLVQGWMNSQRAALNAKIPPKPVHTEVLVAKKNLPTGTLITPAYLEWRPWPEKGIAPTYLVNGRAKLEDLVGSVVRSGIVAGEPIVMARIAKPSDRGFLAAVLRPGMRAMSVPVSATTGISGFLFPGDRIDLILTHHAAAGEGEAKTNTRASETVLENIRVLAIDQSTDDQNAKPSVGKTATLELTPKQVEMVSVAAMLGHLMLSLRSLPPDDGKDGEPPAAEPEQAYRGRSLTTDDEVSRLIGREVDTHVVVIARGSKKEAARVKKMSQ